MRKTLHSLLWIGTLAMPLGSLSLLYALYVVFFRPNIRISRLAKVCVEIEVCALMQLEAMGAGPVVRRQFYEEHFLWMLIGVMQIDEVAALLYINRSWGLLDSGSARVRSAGLDVIEESGAQTLADIVWKFGMTQAEFGPVKGQVS
jgi:hypothetical protein